jgi:hypothetical protein
LVVVVVLAGVGLLTFALPASTTPTLQRVTLPAGTVAPSHGVGAVSCAADGDCLDVLTGGLVLASHDGGASWIQSTTEFKATPLSTAPEMQSCNARDCELLQPNLGAAYATDGRGHFLATARVPMSDSQQWVGISCTASGDFCLALAANPDGTGTLLQSYASFDGVYGFYREGALPLPASLLQGGLFGSRIQISCTGRGTCVVGDTVNLGVFRTTNGGASWVYIAHGSDTNGASSNGITSLSCWSTLDCLVGAMNGLYETTNGFTSWHRVTLGVGKKDLLFGDSWCTSDGRCSAIGLAHWPKTAAETTRVYSFDFATKTVASVKIPSPYFATSVTCTSFEHCAVVGVKFQRSRIRAEAAFRMS